MIKAVIQDLSAIGSTEPVEICKDKGKNKYSIFCKGAEDASFPLI
jgi:hypothetical protein